MAWFSHNIIFSYFYGVRECGSADPTDFKASFDKQTDLALLLGLLPGISLVFFLYGMILSITTLERMDKMKPYSVSAVLVYSLEYWGLY
ncbi:MAG: hypothetical protein CM1200mP3_16870 [Chloroflexota bacterium]|nr:MAG: hypothetical protein CM1200mP3_16870 [Chloroflexota bacterium]